MLIVMRIKGAVVHGARAISRTGLAPASLVQKCSSLKRMGVPHAAFLALLAMLATTAKAAAGDAGKPGLAVRFGPEGLKSLSYAGKNLLAPESGPWIDVYGADGKPINLAGGGATQAKGVVTQKYDSLVVVTEMRQVKDALNLTVTFKNTGKQTIGKATYHPMLLQFPNRLKHWRLWMGWKLSIETREIPGVVEADWGAGKLVVCVAPGSSAPSAEDTDRAMTIGFDGNNGNNPNNSLNFDTVFEPALKPGKSWTFRGSLRFAPSTTPTADVAKDIYEKFAKAYPATLNWPDRRPIGAIYLANSNQKWPTNPRGWFNDPAVDITTAKGKKAFRARLMEYADTCIGAMKDTGAQGMVLWDVEGDEMPHPITYLGDPRILPKAAPEMDANADEFFKKFLDAGLKTGVCIRPSKIVSDLKGGWQHQQVEDHVSDLADKIAYAKKRWGCTLFYMDTNFKWKMNLDPADRSKGMWQGDYQVLPAADLRELCRRHPGVLIFPEFGQVGYYGVCGVYGELRGGFTGVDAEARLVYPDAVRVLEVGNGDYLGNWDDLRAGVLEGSIHLFRGSFPDPVNLLVKRMYQEADFVRRSASVKKTGPLKTLLADSDPLVRFTGVSRTKKPTAIETASLIKALANEKEWVLQRKIVEALGASGDSAAVPVLADLLKNPGRQLDLFAALALGRIGPKATPKLIGFATNKDSRLVELALKGLAQSDDPAAIPTLLRVSENPDANVRAQSAVALGRRPASAVTARLVTMLRDEDTKVVIAACNALGEVKDRAATKPLVELMVRAAVDEDIRIQISRYAGGALEAITGKQYGPFHNLWKKALDDKEI